MCEFASFVLDKTHEYYLQTSNRHTEIIEHYKLREMHPNGLDAAILKVEITPPPENRKAPIDQWNFRIDQDIMPTWFDAADAETRTRAALARRSADERWLIEEIGHQITVGYAGTATAGDDGTATAGYAGTATAGYAGTATAGARGTATAGARGTATAGDDGTATAGDDGEIRIRYYDPKHNRYRTAVGYIGEDGLEPNTAYILDESHKFAREVSP